MAEWCWFNRVKIKCNGGAKRYFGMFKLASNAVTRVRKSATKKAVNCTPHILYCFSADQFLPYSNVKNVGIVSWDDEYDFSKVDLENWTADLLE